MATQLLKLVASQVAVGTALPFGVRDESGKLLLARGFVLRSEEQVQELLRRGAFVDVEEVEAQKQGRAHVEDTRRRSIFDLWDHQVWDLDRLLKSLDGEPDFAGRVSSYVDHFVALVDRDVDAAIFMAMRKDPRRLVLYGLTHGLNSALVCLLLARRLGWSEAALRSLVQAALTMNLTIAELQGQLSVQGRPPTQAQMAQLRAHPHGAEQLLAAAGVADADWLEAVRDHHERDDGTGYPEGKTELSAGARLLRVADVFMAKLSPRADRAPLSIQEAERQLFQESKGSAEAAALIKEFGIYPPGFGVQLASGEICVVIRRGATVQAPLVAAVTDRSGVPVVKTTKRDTAQASFAIAKPAPDAALLLRVPPERLYGWIE